MDKINSAASSGVLVKILEIKDSQAIYPRIAFHAGDDPAQHEVVGIKCGSNVKHGCIRCMYNSRQGGQYKPNIHNLRDLSEIQKIVECEEIFMKSWKGGKHSNNDSQKLKALEDRGYHLISNPFFNARSFNQSLNGNLKNLVGQKVMQILDGFKKRISLDFG